MNANGRWKRTFLTTLGGHRYAEALRVASLQGRLSDWTRMLTMVVVDTCGVLGWRACAKGHRLDLLPEPRSEYLTIDVTAFRAEAGRFPFPVAAIELENSVDDDRIAYSLWKLLCLRTPLRVVYCYRQGRDECSALRHHMEHSVLSGVPREERLRLAGQTLIAMGSRDEAETFPYGFFKWFELERNTSSFRAT